MQLAVIAEAAASGGGGFLGFLPFILILVIIYFLMLRPQMKRQKEQAAMIAALQKNDVVVTSGGIHGRITRVQEKETTLQLEVARGIVITVERTSVARKGGELDFPKGNPAALPGGKDQQGYRERTGQKSDSRRSRGGQKRRPQTQK